MELTGWQGEALAVTRGEGVALSSEGREETEGSVGVRLPALLYGAISRLCDLCGLCVSICSHGN